MVETPAPVIPCPTAAGTLSDPLWPSSICRRPKATCRAIASRFESRAPAGSLRCATRTLTPLGRWAHSGTGGHATQLNKPATTPSSMTVPVDCPLNVAPFRLSAQINVEDPSCNIQIEYGMERRSTEVRSMLHRCRAIKGAVRRGAAMTAGQKQGPCECIVGVFV